MPVIGTYVNTAFDTRSWGALRHPGNDRRPAMSTLELDPGEVVEDLVVPRGFEDPWLKPVGEVADASEGPAEPPDGPPAPADEDEAPSASEGPAEPSPNPMGGAYPTA